MFDDPFSPKRGPRKNSNPFGTSIDFGLGPKPTSQKRDKRRAFTRTQKNEIWAQQNGRCAGTGCGHKQLDPRTVEYDHGRAWSAGGATSVKNGRALCPHCHKLKHHKERLKKVEKKPSSKSQSNSLFGGGMFGNAPKGKKPRNPFDFGF